MIGIGPVLVMLAASLLGIAAVHTYERLLSALRSDLADAQRERDELLDILDANVDDMRRMAMERHPSNRAALRVVR